VTVTAAPPLDVLSGTICQLAPGTIPWGPGWYLVAVNTRVEAGPFLTPRDAERAADWLDDNALGVHPAPWTPRYSATGLLVGSRVRDRRRGGLAESA
jgi:hypothetical protein